VKHIAVNAHAGLITCAAWIRGNNERGGMGKGKGLLERLKEAGAHEDDILFLAKLLNLDGKP
jgi:hypothetical protein